MNCPQCDAPLPKSGPLQGLCAACMLRPNLNPDSAPAVPTRHPMPQLSEVQAEFPQLHVQELVGVGGMGLVYRARQIKLDRQVALKILLPELAQDPAFAERFLREAQALAKLDHPNVVTVYDFGEQAGRYFLMMEYVDGAPLREMMDKGKLSMPRILQLVPEICSGLAYAHEQGIVHRDIKPENILIDRYGEAKIADFGLVKLLDRDEKDWRLTRASQVMGTPQYMAPEQMTKPREVDHRADIYSMGVVLYEMLTGEPPVGRFELPSERVRVDARLDAIVLKAMESDPDNRYQRVRELGDRVALLSAEAAPAGPIQPIEAFEATPGQSELDRFRTPIAFNNHIDPLFGSRSSRGRIWFEADAVIIEWCQVNEWGTTLLPVTVMRLSLQELMGVTYRARWWGQGEITLSCRNPDVLGAYPMVRIGEIRLFVSLGQRGLAERFSQTVGLLLHHAAREPGASI